MNCSVYPFGSLGKYKFVVVLSRFRGQWMLSRHKSRGTWETQGGHIEAYESPEQAARRELFEESGALQYLLQPLCDYYAQDEVDGEGEVGGQAFFAGIEALGALPESEMAQVAFFDALPDSLTYPSIAQVLVEECRRRYPDDFK